MATSPSAAAGRSTWSWPRRAGGAASTALAAAVFAGLDVADALLCLVYAFLDGVLEDSPVRCYCHRRSHDEHEHGEVSDTLYARARSSAVRDALLGLLRRLVVVVVVVRRTNSKQGRRAPPEPCRWSDCACKSCVAWRGGEGEAGGRRLHVVVKEPAAAPKDRFADAAAGTATGTRTADPENAVFVHGFTSSSSFWAETVFRESAILGGCCRLLAVDLLGFGRSPKPADCMYTVRDHVEAIERSLLITLAGDNDDGEPPQTSLLSGGACFHLVAHSMGCIIALALAAKHPTRVKSITLVAPPYFPPCEQAAASQVALNTVAEKKLWPPLLFGSAVMSWYEHVGRTVCFLVCRNHRLWEWLLSLLLLPTETDGADFIRVRDLTRHTHHSAWHTMHNVICGGARARLQDANLEAVAAAGVPLQVLHGADDQVVPVDCGRQLVRAAKKKLPRGSELRVMDGRDHATVVLGRERDFALELKAFWCSAAAAAASRDRH